MILTFIIPGAHVAGYAGAELNGFVRRITGNKIDSVYQHLFV